MCLILFALDAHPAYKLILAANRDEFHARPTAAADFWTDAPELLAGKDLAAGGTWLGITKKGRFAAVTNYRDPLAPIGEKSRGRLTKDFLTGSDSPENYLRKIEREKGDYSGFNLLVGDFGGAQSELFYFSNRGGKIEKISGGIYGLSNALLDTPWHKVEAGKSKLAKILRSFGGEISPAPLLEILADKNFAPDKKLPDTGVGKLRERVLSPAFIETDDYGTRLSTILLIKRSGAVHFAEKTFIGVKGEAKFNFTIETATTNLTKS